MKKPIKGIVLAGGSGSRLYPLTKMTNKHLLPIYDQPMIYYPIKAMVNAGIKDVLIVTGKKNATDFLNLLGEGAPFGLDRIQLAYQEEGNRGIADALKAAQTFGAGGPICVMLGDNIIENDICEAVAIFSEANCGAHIVLKEVPDPERFGCPDIVEDKIVKIEEKPKTPKSSFAVTGIYLYDETVFDKVNRVQPSWRGELEITDVNNMYIAENRLNYSILSGWWTDAGTFDSLLQAWNLVAKTGANNLIPRSPGTVRGTSLLKNSAG